MKLYTGRSEQELMDCLQELDQHTNLDSVIKSGQRIKINAVRETNHMRGWSIETEPSSGKIRLLSKGKRYDSFFETIGNLDQTKHFAIDNYVLCYADAEKNLEWDGTLKTHWVKIDPYSPFTMKDGKPYFDTITLNVEPDDLPILLETKLAFYSRINGVYPIKKEALPSIGHFLDCSGIFKNLSDMPLGTALSIAEKIAGEKKMKFLYREASNTIKPVLSVMGASYTYYPQVKFFRDCLDLVGHTIGLYMIDKWNVYFDHTDLYITLVMRYGACHNDDFSIGFKFRTGDLYGEAMSVTLYAAINGNTVLLKKNSAYHSAKFTEVHGGVKKLFEGMPEAIEEFENAFSVMQCGTISLSDSMIQELYDPVIRIVGKKRAQTLSRVQPGVYNTFELYNFLISFSPPGLNLKQSTKLWTYYGSLVPQLNEESSVSYELYG